MTVRLDENRGPRSPDAAVAGTPAGAGAPSIAVVVPTVGRPTLRPLLSALDAGPGRRLERVVVVDDRRDPHPPLELPDRVAGAPLRLLTSGGRGPATARNLGWRAVTSQWVAFLDDDVVPAPAWAAALAVDLAGLPPDVGGCQGRLRVPLPGDRRPTDWERNVAGLETATWATADLAYRRTVLEEVGGFDERFPRAYREDADLGLRVSDAGYLIVRGTRRVDHPVRAAGPWVSVRAQVGNADDALLEALHGPRWRARTGAAPGRNGRHLMTTAALVLAVAAVAAGRRRPAAAASAAWLFGTGAFAARRVAPGPRRPAEVVTMVATSAVIPPVATFHRAAGWLRWRIARPEPWSANTGRGRVRGTRGDDRRPRAVLFDRDGTLIEDVPFNGDPALVRPMPGAHQALHRLRCEGLRIGVVTNQSGIGRGLIDADDLAAVNRRVDELLGPIDTWQACPHIPDDRCGCRKPAPGLIEQAAQALGMDPAECVVIGDIGADMAAAAAAGSRAILVPTPATLGAEVRAAAERAPTLDAAVAMVLEGAP